MTLEKEQSIFIKEAIRRAIISRDVLICYLWISLLLSNTNLEDELPLLPKSQKNIENIDYLKRELLINNYQY